MERQGGRCRRLVLVPFPLQGHISPMLQLGTILHSRGFSITIAHTTNLGSPDASKHPDFVFLPLSSDDSSSTTESKDSDDFIVFVSDLNLNHRASLQEQLTEMVEKQEQHEELPCIVLKKIGKIVKANEKATKGYESHIGKIRICQGFSRLYKEIKSLVSNCTN
ncbi:hypothetical protein ACOSQ3_025461 [Xanthoceras sorbifolium]